MILNEKQVWELQDALSKTLKDFDLSDIKENTDNTNSFKVIATDASVDRDGEVLTIDGWEIENYLKNPVMFIDHNSWSINYIASKVTKIYFENNQMVIEGIFTDKTEAWRIAQSLYQDGFLKTVSVGFLIKSRNEDNNKIIERKELYEISWVGVPCNPNATSLDGKTYQKGLELGIIKEIQEENQEDIVVPVTQEQVKELNEKMDKILDMLNGKSVENEKKFENFEQKEFLQELNRSISEKLKDMKKPV